MGTKRLRSGLLLFAAALTLVALPATPEAQTEPTRPRVALTQIPLLSELWPADFNEDGITDIVAGRIRLETEVQIGVGDGTFRPGALLADGVTPVGVGDLNHDGHIDVLMTAEGSASPTGSIAAGRGDGTFGAPVAVNVALAAPTYVLDLNNDGKRDLVVAQIPPRRFFPSRPDLVVYPGNGDFTFGPPVTLRPPAIFVGLALADVNGDGFTDIIANSTGSRQITIFENLGNFSFATTAIPLPDSGAGVAARDVNGDGMVDLIAGQGSWDTSYWSSGAVLVLLGTGNGTFAAPVRYAVNTGPVLIVIGDFNGDGSPDIATGNQSTERRCEDMLPYFWDSVSILPGRGDGTFGPTASFALGNGASSPPSLGRLNTSDLNADGRTDLLVSPGAILLSLPPGPNTAPVANAGPDRVFSQNTFGQDFLAGSASDADHDWLTFEWRDDLGNLRGTLPRQCFSTSGSQQLTRAYTLTVTDPFGASSADTVQWTFLGQRGPAPGPVPANYSAHDIGDVQTAGYAGFINGVYRIAGSGADIWGTSDAFRFVNTAVTGDFDVVARVDAIENIDQWTKAGLMVRETLSADARHAFVLATPTAVKGVAFQRRPTGSAASVHTAGPLVAPPIWLRLQRRGDALTAFTRASDSEAWASLDTQTLSGLSATVYVGMAVTSHRAGALATAFFSGFVITGEEPPPAASTLPATWQRADVGPVAAAGDAAFDGVTFDVSGSGADIWGTQDEFQYAYTTLSGDGVAIVRVRSVTGPHEWAKAGLMIRQSLDPSSAHHYLLRSLGRGAAYQRRANAGESTLHTEVESPPPDGSIWYRIERVGGTIRLSSSTVYDAPVWHSVGDAAFPTGDVLIGLAVTSHADGAMARGVFDRFSLTRDEPPPPAATWSSDIVGPVAIAGASNFDGTTHALQASGLDIWGSMDSFRYTHQTLVGDGTITARVASLAGPHAWTKAGVMIRASLDPSAAHGFMFVSRDNGVAFQRRVASGVVTTHTSGGSSVAPQWVRLTRTGATITAAVSADGTNWFDVGSDALDIGAGPVLVGLALTSHDNSRLATGTFDHVTVAP